MNQFNLNTVLKPRAVFNPEGQSFDNPIMGGTTSGIMALNECRYKKVVNDLYKYGTSLHWLPERQDMTHDKVQYLNLLPEFKEAYDTILSFLIFMDSAQTENPMRFTQYITAQEFSLLLAIQTFQEAIHTQSYSYITESVMPVEDRRNVYDRIWRDNGLLKTRNMKIADAYQTMVDTPTVANVQRALLANYILEGVYFYNGFMFFNKLALRGEMKATNEIINLIKRDEIFHILVYEVIINAIKEEGVWVIPEQEVYELFNAGLLLEEKFSKSVLDRCIGFNDKLIENYTRYRVNRLLKKIGYRNNPWKDYTTNPHKKYDDLLENPTNGTVGFEQNLFTGQSSTYVRSDSMANDKGGFNDLL